MMVVIAGTDVSGFDDERGQHKVITIVIGTEEAINALHNEIGLARIHIRDLKPSKRDKVKKKLIFKSKDILGLSLTVGKNRIVRAIHEHRKKKEQFASIGAVYANFDHLLLEKIHSELDRFLSKYGIKLKDVRFQDDGDMRHTLLNWRFDRVEEGKAHELADGLAHFCKLGHKISGCVRHDFERELEEQMNQDCMK